jgi:Secretion system C-terminal sorting domain
VQPNLGPDASICPGGIRTLTPGSGFVSYQWQDLSTGASFTAWQAGSYWVTTTDGCGAVGRDTLVLSPDNSFQVSLGPDTVVCQGSSITLDAGAGQASYLWSNGATTPSISISSPGLYWVEVVNASGCYDRDTIAVDLCVGLSGGPGDIALVFYPNPADAELHVRFSRAVAGDVEVELRDMLGRLVHAQAGADTQALRIPLDALAQGVYQVQVRAEGREFVVRVVKR